MLQNLDESAALGFGKSLRDVFPVCDVPDRLHKVWTHVLVLQIIRMFPHVYGEQWKQTWTYKYILYIDTAELDLDTQIHPVH